jgi:ribose transport system substrate-binding protein
MNREKGFRDVIESDGRFRILDTQYAGSDIALAQTLAQRMITENNDLAGLFGTNEETTTGVGSAIKMSQSQVTGIGFDITDIIQGFLDDGTLQAVMVQNPYTMGYLGMAETIAALRGIDTGPPFINTGVSVRTKYTR